MMLRQKKTRIFKMYMAQVTSTLSGVSGKQETRQQVTFVKTTKEKVQREIMSRCTKWPV